MALIRSLMLTITLVLLSTAGYAVGVSNDKDIDLEETILTHLNTLGRAEAVQISKLQAAISASDMAYADGNISDATKLLNLAPQNIDTNAIANSQNILLVNTIKHMLAARDELLTIQGGELSEPEDLLISELANAGDSTAHLHAMFDVIKLAKAEPYKNALKEWEENFKGSETWTWDYSKLNAWIDSQKDESIKMRMLEALEYFEFNLNASK